MMDRKYSFDNNLTLDKKHVIITGSIGSGKTTLRKTIVDAFAQKTNIYIPGITTWVIHGEAVYLKGEESDQPHGLNNLGKLDEPNMLGELNRSDEINESDEPIKIGEFDEEFFAKEGKMKPIEDGFNVSGVGLLNRLLDMKSEWVFIDEIGYLESTCIPYLNKINEVFEKKRVIAVVRKQNLDFLNQICARTDALLIDLDQ